MGTKDLYEVDNVPIENEFSSPKLGYRAMLYIIKPRIEALKKRKIIPEQSSFIAPSQASLFDGLSGFTATCLTFKRNKLGRRYCAKYAPTCGSADEGCRYEPAPVPGALSKRTKKDTEIEANALAQMLADDANADLEQNKVLMREILSYGGIAPHRGGFLKEEYAEIPTKYKRADGIPLDELAQEMGMDEATITDKIYEAEAQFRQLKEMRRGKTARKFNREDFIEEAWDRMRSGRAFLGIFGDINLLDVPYAESGKFRPDLTKNQIRVRIIDPLLFRKYFIRRSTTPGVQYAMGINKKGNALTQSIRFSRKLFNLENAKAWFKQNIDRIIKNDMKSSAA
jgi:hypothetical protein